MISVKYIVRIIAGAIVLWLAMGCSVPYRDLDNTSSPQPTDQEPPKKILI